MSISGLGIQIGNISDEFKYIYIFNFFEKYFRQIIDEIFWPKISDEVFQTKIFDEIFLTKIFDEIYDENIREIFVTEILDE